jgi:hypothetical protein
MTKNRFAKIIGRMLMIGLNYATFRYFGAEVWQAFAFSWIMTELSIIRAEMSEIE